MGYLRGSSDNFIGWDDLPRHLVSLLHAVGGVLNTVGRSVPQKQKEHYVERIPQFSGAFL